ncbi:MAG: FG-GAP-like repeat-containing protein [bacterium]|nr:FG-GAP-like repeat-containing protein [bacterium]
MIKLIYIRRCQLGVVMLIFLNLQNLSANQPTTPVLPAIDTRGGPDLAGYQWTDDLEPFSPSFQWLTLNTTPFTKILQGVHRNNEIGFGFPYYDSTYTVCHISSCGWLSFISPDSAFTVNQGMPTAAPPNGVIAPYWDNLYESSYVQGIRAARYDSSRYVVTWHVSRNSSVYEFQVILHRSGQIIFQYNQLGANLTSATVGIENHLGHIGQFVCRNEEFVRLHSAITFRRIQNPSNPFPPDATTEVRRDQRLSWSFDVLARHYEVRLDTMSPPERIIAQSVRTNYWDVPLLLPYQRYYWQVIADDSINTRPSQIWQFVTSNVYRPSPPVQAWISDVTATSLTLKWFPANSECSGYRIYRSMQDNPYELVDTVASDDSLSISCTGLSPYTKCRFKVFSIYDTLTSFDCAEAMGWTATAPVVPPTIDAVSYNWAMLNIYNNPQTPNPNNARYAITDELSGLWLNESYSLTSPVPIWFVLGLNDSIKCMILNLFPATQYRFALYALDSASAGGYRAGAVSVRTNESFSYVPFRTVYWISNPSADSRNHEFGKQLCPIGDVNADGRADLLVSLPEWIHSTRDYGEMYISRQLGNNITPTLFGPITNPIISDTLTHFGVSTANIGDIDGNGTEEYVTSVQPEQGQGYVLCYRNYSQFPVYRIEGSGVGSFGAKVVAIGDVTCDSVTDLLVTDPIANSHVISSGVAYLYDGYRGTLIDCVASPTPRVGGRFGENAAGVGDLNRDGKPEFAVVAPYETSDNWSGAVYIFDGASKTLFRTHYGSPGEELGKIIAGGIDVTGDIIPEYFLSAPGFRNGLGFRTGKVNCFNGATGTLLYSILSPEYRADNFAVDLVLTQDITSDGYPDLLIASNEYDYANQIDAGKVDFFRATDGLHVSRLQLAVPLANHRFGSRLAILENADQAPTIIVSALGLSSQRSGQVIGYQSTASAVGRSEAGLLPVGLQCSVYPNPSNSQIQVRFSLPTAGEVNSRLYETTGRELHRPIRGSFSAGDHVAPITLNGFSSGIYYLEIEANQQRRFCKILLVK